MFLSRNEILLGLLRRYNEASTKVFTATLLALAKKLETTKYLLKGEYKNKSCPSHAVEYHTRYSDEQTRAIGII